MQYMIWRPVRRTNWQHAVSESTSRIRRWLLRQSHPMLRIAQALRDPMLRPAMLDPGAVQRVLVIAPHMDDEAIGCGGAVLRHVGCGASVAVVYLTDGSMGDARLYAGSLTDAQRTELRMSLRQVRRAEGQAWCQAAGVRDVEFLDGPDSQIGGPAGTALAAPLAGLLRRLRPQVVYLPSPLDTHADHRAANVIAGQAMAEWGEGGCMLRGYEVWSPLVANAVMDITDVFEAKMSLLALHASQMVDIDYARAIGGLNAYRAVLLPARTGFAEAFVDLGVAAHRKVLTAAQA